MTYAAFLGLFLGIPILLLSLLLRRHLLARRYWSTTALLLVPVFVCMAPWDHAAIALGIWSWTPQQIWGIRIWQIPLEELLFSLLQTLLVTMLLYACNLWWQVRSRSAGENCL